MLYNVFIQLIQLLNGIIMSEHIKEDLTRLRNEFIPRAFNADGSTKDSTLAEVVFKINSCLGKGYPRRAMKGEPKSHH